MSYIITFINGYNRRSLTKSKVQEIASMLTLTKTLSHLPKRYLSVTVFRYSCIRHTVCSYQT